jgi:hypothetical protein
VSHSLKNGRRFVQNRPPGVSSSNDHGQLNRARVLGVAAPAFPPLKATDTAKPTWSRGLRSRGEPCRTSRWAATGPHLADAVPPPVGAPLGHE